MAQAATKSKVYLDDQGEPTTPPDASKSSKVYLDENGEPTAPPVSSPVAGPGQFRTVRDPRSPVKKPTTASGAWQKANEGMVGPDTIAKAQDAITPNYVKEINAPNPSDSPMWTGIKTFAKGVRDSGNRVLSSLTSPVSAALTAATAGESLVPEAAQAAYPVVRGLVTVGKTAGTVAGAGYGATGGAQAVESGSRLIHSAIQHPMQTAEGYVNPDDAEGFLGGAGGAGLGTVGAYHSVKGIAPKTSSRLYNMAADVGPDALKYTNPGEQMQKEGLFAWTKKGLRDKTNAAADAVGGKIDPILDAATHRGIRVNARPSFDPMLERMKTSLEEGEPATHNKMSQFVDEKAHEIVRNPQTGLAEVDLSQPKNLRSMTPSDATTLKRGFGRARWSGDPDSQTLESGRREAHHTLKEAINAQVPEVRPHNERYAGLSEAGDSLDDSVREDAAKGPFGHASDYVTGSAIGGLTGVLTHSPSHTIEAVGTGILAKKVLGSTPVLTGLGKLLGKQEELPGIPPVSSTAPGQNSLPPGQYPAGPSSIIPPRMLPGPTTGQGRLVRPGAEPQPASTMAEPKLLEHTKPMEGEYLPPDNAGLLERGGASREAEASDLLEDMRALPSARGKKLSTVTPATPVTRFHGTPGVNADQIMENGIIPSIVEDMNSRKRGTTLPPQVSLAPTFERALDWAKDANEYYGGTDEYNKHAVASAEIPRSELTAGGNLTAHQELTSSDVVSPSRLKLLVDDKLVSDRYRNIGAGRRDIVANRGINAKPPSGHSLGPDQPGHPEGQHVRDVIDPSGKKIGNVEYWDLPGNKIEVSWIGDSSAAETAGDPNINIGVKGTRDLIRQIRAENPGVESITGERISGIKAGSDNPRQTLNLKGIKNAKPPKK